MSGPSQDYIVYFVSLLRLEFLLASKFEDVSRFFKVFCSQCLQKVPKMNVTDIL